MTSKTNWTIGVAILSVIIASVALLGDTLSPASPKAAALEMIDTLRDGDYLRYAALMHPEMIREFQTMLGALISSAKAAPLREAFFGTSDLLELGRFNDLELLARFLEGAIEREPEVQGAFADSKTTILGVVYEGKDLAHVVYRIEFEVYGFHASSPDLVTMRRHEKSWRLALTTEMRLLMQQIAASVRP